MDPPDFSYSFTVNLNVELKEIYIRTKNLDDEGIYKMKLTAQPWPGISLGISKEV